MQLPIARQLSYISPSTFLTWRACQYKVYSTKLAGHKILRQESSLPAQLGIAFDGYVKQWLAKKLNITSPVVNLSSLHRDITRPEMLDLGKKIASAYIKTDFVKPLLTSIDSKIDQECYKIYGGVPILGVMDFVIGHGEGYVPFDWKTRGFQSSNVMYPTSGYGARLDIDLNTGCLTKVIHDDGKLQDKPLEERNEDWAIQMLFYNWLVCSGEDVYTGRIHEVVIQGDTIVIVDHHAFISREFAKKIKTELNEMWENLYGQLYYADIQPPAPHIRKCEKYNQVCEAAHLCKPYMESLGDRDRRVNYV